jgi:hypothetical protein
MDDGSGNYSEDVYDSRQIKAYRSGRWVEGIHYKKHSPDPFATEGRATLLYNYTKINKLVGDT